MIDKLIIEVLQKKLGNNYEVYDSSFFEQNFTNTVQYAGMNTETRINYDTFNKYGDKIIAVFASQPAEYASASFTAINTTYTLTLWVPINANIINSNGEYLKTPKFNVEKDIIDLRNSFNNKTIQLSDGYKCEMTFGEPVCTGSYDLSGVYRRKIVVISGKINLNTSGYFGRDYKLELGKTDGDEINYIEIKDFNYLSFTPQPSPVENHEQGKIIPEENVEAIKQACSFSLDDANSNEELNELLTTIAISGKQSIETYILKISKYKNGSYFEYASYPVYLAVNLTYQFGVSDTGVFSVNCMRSEE